MLEKIKNLFGDNYKVLSLLTVLYVVFLYLYNLHNLSLSSSSLYYSFETPF